MMHYGNGDFRDPTHAVCHNIVPCDITHWMQLPAPPVNNNTHNHQLDDKTSQKND